MTSSMAVGPTVDQAMIHNPLPSPGADAAAAWVSPIASHYRDPLVVTERSDG